MRSLLLVLILLLSLCPIVSGKVNEQELDFACMTQDCFVDALETDYSYANWLETGNRRSTNSLFVGQDKAFTLFAIYRTLLYFNTSELSGREVKVKEAYIRLYVDTDNSRIDFDLVAQVDNGTYPHCPAQAVDYNRVNYDGLTVGTLDTKKVDNKTFAFLDLSGSEWLNTDGLTKFVLRSQRDIDEIEPLDSYPPNEKYNEWLLLDSTGASNPPLLHIKLQDIVKAGKGSEAPQLPQVNSFVFVLLAGAGATVLFYAKRKPEVNKKVRWEW